ncbi:ankyrin-like protein [Seal parapoxvirus]|nr:ankyrin-like protein [Seal parapoxvirus]ASC55520.1 ankyrin-like protein [Seal parapoxvirus]
MGCDPRAPDLGGNTVLHYLATYGRCGRSMLEFLLRAGVDLDARNHRSQTALFRAAVFNPSACRRLLQAGADPFAVSDSGFCAAAEIMRRDNVRAAAALLERRPPLDALLRALAAATRWGYLVPRPEAPLMCVHSLVLRGAGGRVLADPALGEYAPVVARAAREVAQLREVRCHRDASLLDVLRSSERSRALRIHSSFLDRALDFAVYGRALFGKVCGMRLRAAAAARVAELLCPCALPPELVSAVLSFLSYEELLAAEAALRRPEGGGRA